MRRDEIGIVAFEAGDKHEYSFVRAEASGRGGGGEVMLNDALLDLTQLHTQTQPRDFLEGPPEHDHSDRSANHFCKHSPLMSSSR